MERASRYLQRIVTDLASCSNLQEYLVTKGLVHRDLAARNILVGNNEVMKITDFGMTRLLYEEVYQTQTKKKMPIKWMAPETLRDLVFTTQSDV